MGEPGPEGDRGNRGPRGDDGAPGQDGTDGEKGMLSYITIKNHNMKISLFWASLAHTPNIVS